MSFEAELTNLRALRLLELVDPMTVVLWARARLPEDDGVQPMYDLAGLTGDSGNQVDTCLNAVAQRLGMPPLDRATAGRLAAEHAAELIADGEIEPIKGARRIWQIARLAPAVEPMLRSFVGLASEWEDDAENRIAYDEDIRREARFMLGRTRGEAGEPSGEGNKPV